MRIFFAITMFFAMLIQNFSMGIVMADFYLHRDQIADELCENKDKLQLNCLGNCQLKKELEKKNDTETPTQFKELSIFLNPAVQTFTAIVFSGENPSFPHMDDNRLSGFIPSVFHPPA